MPRIIGGILARNEADRYLDPVIANLWSFCDEVVLLDDHSTDGTAALAASRDVTVIAAGDLDPMWGHETPARIRLWNLLAERCGPDDWIYIADADHILHGAERFREVVDLSWEANAACFTLYDVWDPSHRSYRCDGFWQAHLHPRPWAFAPKRVPDGWVAEWADRGIHAGHCPQNFPVSPALVPEDCYIIHLGWAKESDRRTKLARYQEVTQHMTDFEKAHLASVDT